MADSKVHICNMALSYIGSRSTIENINEPEPNAQQCKLWYDPARRQALAAYNWSFAKKRIALGLHNDPPPVGLWNFRYQFPADCIKAREIENLGGPDVDAIPFEIESGYDGDTKTILCDQEQAKLIYTFDQRLVQMFSETFVEAFAHMLAHKISMSLTGKESIQDKNLQWFLQWLRVAEAEDANEHVDKAPRDADWIRDRQ